MAQNWGNEGVRGAIIEPACAIGTATGDQAIELVGKAADELEYRGPAIFSPLRLQLISCALSRPGIERHAARYFQMTFEGPSRDGVFVVDSGGREVKVQIADSAGRNVSPGEPLSVDVYIPQDRVLSYSVRQVETQGGVAAEHANSVLRFYLDYF